MCTQKCTIKLASKNKEPLLSDIPNSHHGNILNSEELLVKEIIEFKNNKSPHRSSANITAIPEEK